MNFIILTAFFIIAVFVSSNGMGKKQEFMDRNFTCAIKGIAILTVIWAHSSASLGIGGIQFIAGVGVALFLLCSGYGLEKSYEKKGLVSFWKNRLVKLCFPYWIVAVVILIVDKSISWKKILGIILFQEGGWFIKYIVICYILFFVCKKIIEKFGISKELMILSLMFIVWFIIETAFFTDSGAPFLEARQMVSFISGIVIAKNYKKIEVLICKKGVIVLGGTVGILFMAITQMNIVKNGSLFISNFLSLFTVLPLAIALLGILSRMYFIMNSRFLALSGMLSYEIFLIHAHTNYLINGTLFSLISCFVLTYVLSWGLHTIVTMKGR